MAKHPNPHRFGAAIGIMVGVLALCGCTRTTTTTGPTDAHARAANNDRVGTGAPQDLHDIAGYLLRHRAEKFKLPDSLAQLRLQGYMPMDGYPHLADYAYQPEGLGTLSSGQKIILVDTAVRLEGHLWCLLQEPNLHPRAAALNVTLVRIEDLQEAARQSR